MIYNYLILIVFNSFFLGTPQVKLNLGSSYLLGDNIKDSNFGPSIGIEVYISRFEGFEEGIGINFYQAEAGGDSLYRYVDFTFQSQWTFWVGKFMPYFSGFVGLSRWWVVSNGRVVRFVWGDRYEAFSFLLGGGMGARIPMKKGALDFQIGGRFLFSQNQQRFGIKDENEGSVGFSVGYVIQL